MRPAHTVLVALTALSLGGVSGAQAAGSAAPSVPHLGAERSSAGHVEPMRSLTFDDIGIQEQSAGRPWSITRFNGILRFEVRQGERRARDSERGLAIERSEIQLQKQLRFGVDYVVSYDFRVEPGAPNTSAWVNIGQMHATQDPEDATHLGPLFAVQLAGERMRIVARADAQRVSVARPPDLWLYRDDARLVRGRWYRMEIDIRVAPAGGGIVVVKRDGRLLVNYRGPLGYNDALGPYWKLGVYRSGSPEPLAVSFRGFSLSEPAG